MIHMILQVFVLKKNVRFSLLVLLDYKPKWDSGFYPH